MRRQMSLPVVLLLVAAGLVLFSAVRVVTGAHDLTSDGQAAAALQLAVPVGLAGLGGLWAERAGVVNIGLEGMMILGTWCGAWAGYQWGPWVGVLVGVLGGALGGLTHAVVTVTFGVNHIISGVAINILAGGATQYLSRLAFDGVQGGTPVQSPNIDPLPRWTVPHLADWLTDINREHWFLVSDLAGLCGGLVRDISALTVIAVTLVPLSFLVLWRTPFGLRLRSCGEAPVAAESLGVNVYLYKYIGVITSGALAGLGGVFLAEVTADFYREGQTSGRGYIGLAAMIFGNWRPGGLAMGAGLFGFTDSLRLRNNDNVRALLLLLAVLLVLLALWQLYRRSYLAASFSVVFGAGSAVWYVLSDEVPAEFIQAAPYLTTLLVLAFSSQRLRMPKADGIPYRRGEGT
ncbi:ABC transporter permease [Wenjunlia vitaminophila]|uniref:ABC transporter permease n=2 Tax=Wenjunlia vitaminophila TaxID=76728 RepID=A0A0T6LM65_WENVI|nr:ABC transporter permease [Wenjunlia vitaminophila]